MSKGSPRFTFRLPQKDKDALAEMAKLYGAASPGGFLAEMVGAMCSNDMERVKGFVGRLVAKAGEQLTLQLNATVDHAAARAGKPQAAAAAGKPAQKPRKRPGRVKEPPRHARRL